MPRLGHSYSNWPTLMTMFLRFIYPMVSSLSTFFSSPGGLCLRPQAQQPKPHLPLFHPAIGCWHLYLTNSFKLRSMVI